MKSPTTSRCRWIRHLPRKEKCWLNYEINQETLMSPRGQLGRTAAASPEPLPSPPLHLAIAGACRWKSARAQGRRRRGLHPRISLSRVALPQALGLHGWACSTRGAGPAGRRRADPAPSRPDLASPVPVPRWGAGRGSGVRAGLCRWCRSCRSPAGRSSTIPAGSRVPCAGA